MRANVYTNSLGRFVSLFSLCLFAIVCVLVLETVQDYKVIMICFSTQPTSRDYDGITISNHCTNTQYCSCNLGMFRLNVMIERNDLMWIELALCLAWLCGVVYTLSVCAVGLK